MYYLCTIKITITNKQLKLKIMNTENIIINYSGWISVAKEDLKVVMIDENGNMVDVDTTTIPTEGVIEMLKFGDIFLKSFGETYSNDSIDGDDEFTFEVEID